MVVPAYNPGRYIQRTLRSLLDQTLSPDKYELIFVDDGSTDGTGEWLDRAARQHPELIRVTHIPNSGWPGRPRNIGTDLARYKYVFYCDADDWLPERSLETLLGRIETDDSDLVVSRAIGNRRSVPFAIFEHGDYCTNWRETPAIFSNLTTQKLFRRKFLEAHDLRFSEGRVRLEDFIFMTQAYLQADRISILGSTPCYVLERRDDGGNLTSTPADESDYFRSVERIIDVVFANTTDGAERDIALNRVLRAELVASVTSAAYLRKDRAAREATFASVRRLLTDRIPVSADARLDRRGQRACAAIRGGDRESLERWTRWETAVTATVQVTEVCWERDRLRVRLALALNDSAGVIRLERNGDEVFLRRSAQSERQSRLGDRLDVTGEFERTAVHIRLRSLDHSEEWRARADLALSDGDSSPTDMPLSWTATAVLDLSTVAAGKPLRNGTWDVYVQLSSCGLTRDRRAGAAELESLNRPPALITGQLIITPFWTDSRNLSLEIAALTLARLAAMISEGSRTATVDRTVVTIPMRARIAGELQAVQVLMSPVRRRKGKLVPIPSDLAADGDSARLQIVLPSLHGAHRWRIRVAWADSAGRGSELTDVLVARAKSTGRYGARGIGQGYRIEPLTAREDMDKPTGASGARTQSPTWQRRALDLASRLGLKVTNLRPGTVIMSRTDRYDVRPVVRNQSWVVNRRRKAAPAVHRLDNELTVVSAGGDVLGAQSVGDRAWLLAPGLTCPPRDLGVETRTMQRLGSMHIAWLLQRYRVDCVLDVGANRGQFATNLRQNGYRGHIVSFEPVPAFVDDLKRRATSDDKWTVQPFALGSRADAIPFRVQRSFSSALESSDYGRSRFATLRDFADTEQIEVPVRRLDDVLDEILAPVVATGTASPRLFLKMDTQGFDLEVFRGIGSRLQQIVGLQSEVALLLVYEQMPRMPEALATYEAAGFEISGLYPVTREPDGRIIEFDCVMVRSGSLPK